MNVDRILRTLNEGQVDYLLIGGMNFLIRHLPELTFDVDIWVRDDAENLARVNGSLQQLGAEWGRTEKEWRPIPDDWRWLETQSVFCLTTAFGAVDVFRDVWGLEGQYSECKARGIPATTAAGVAFTGLSDQDMLTCQEVLPTREQKIRRMEVLRKAIAKAKGS